MALLAVLATDGCSREPADRGPASPAFSRQYRQGPLTAILSASTTNLTVAGKLQLALEVHAPAGVPVSFPPVEQLAGPMVLERQAEDPERDLPNGRRLHRISLVLQPSLPGTVLLGPFDIAAGTDAIETDAVELRIASVLPVGGDMGAIRDIAGPVVSLAGEGRWSTIGLLTSGLGLAVLIAAFAIRLRRPGSGEEVPPHVAALQALESLPADPVGRVHALSRILRTYAAASWPDAGDAPALGDAARFLDLCDQFRFSNQVPDGFADEAEQTVRGIIGQTLEVAP